MSTNTSLHLLFFFSSVVIISAIDCNPEENTVTQCTSYCRTAYGGWKNYFNSSSWVCEAFVECNEDTEEWNIELNKCETVTIDSGKIDNVTGDVISNSTDNIVTGGDSDNAQEIQIHCVNGYFPSGTSLCICNEGWTSSAVEAGTSSVINKCNVPISEEDWVNYQEKLETSNTSLIITIGVISVLLLMWVVWFVVSIVKTCRKCKGENTGGNDRHSCGCNNKNDTRDKDNKRNYPQESRNNGLVDYASKCNITDFASSTRPMDLESYYHGHSSQDNCVRNKTYEYRGNEGGEVENPELSYALEQQRGKGKSNNNENKNDSVSSNKIPNTATPGWSMNKGKSSVAAREVKQGSKETFIEGIANAFPNSNSNLNCLKTQPTGTHSWINSTVETARRNYHAGGIPNKGGCPDIKGKKKRKQQSCVSIEVHNE